MLANRRRDTGPELAVRRELFAHGYRYRVDFAPLREQRRRRADIVFTRVKLAVFLDGCFWHSCPEHATSPRRNADYWLPKLEANRRRDRDKNLLLESAGWHVLRFWEHVPPAEVVKQIEETYLELDAQRGTDR